MIRDEVSKDIVRGLAVSASLCSWAFTSQHHSSDPALAAVLEAKGWTASPNRGLAAPFRLPKQDQKTTDAGDDERDEGPPPAPTGQASRREEQQHEGE